MIVVRTVLFPRLSTAAYAVVLVGAGCSSKTADLGPGGGPAVGAADTHCASRSPRMTNPASCNPPDAGVPSEAGMPMGDASVEVEAGIGTGYGPTMFGAEGDDDDCKYHVKFTITPTHANEDETIVLTATTKADGKPATGDLPRAEIFFGDTLAAPETAPAVETAPGTYTFARARFLKSGRWTVRFHFHELCADTLDDSPHGHAAFFVDVP